MALDIPPRRILLADDDPGVRLGIADLLAGLGLEILHAETGLEALEVARLGRIHAAVLDFQMPGCTGLEALPMIHREMEGLPCIVCSGSLTTVLERTILEAGACAVLPKPVRPTLLRREVLRALEISPYLRGLPGLPGSTHDRN